MGNCGKLKNIAVKLSENCGKIKQKLRKNLAKVKGKLREIEQKLRKNSGKLTFYSNSINGQKIKNCPSVRSIPIQNLLGHPVGQVQHQDQE